MTTNHFDTMIAGVRKAEMDAIAAYEQLYCDLADGKESPESAVVFEILRRADRTAEELQADVQWRRDRNKKIAQYLEIPQLEEKQRAAETQRDKLMEEKLQIMDEYRAKIQPLDWQIDGAKMQIMAARRLTHALATDCRCEALLTGLAEAETLLQSKMTPLAELEKEIDDARQRLDYWAEMQSTNNQDDRKVAASQVRVWKPQLRDLQHKWEVLKLDTDRLEAECDRIRQEMIVA